MNFQCNGKDYQLKEVESREEFLAAFPLLLALMQDQDPEEAARLSEDICYRSWNKSKEQGYLLHICRHEGEVIAVLGLQELYDPVSVEPYFRINNLIVAEKFRRQGLGSKLFDVMEKIVFERGGNMIILEVLGTNIKAKNFYDKLGYKYVCDRMWKTLVGNS